MVTRPAPARVLSASRTGVLETPSTAARSVSTRDRPGLSSPTRIACLIASSTATVRDGSAPAAPVRNADFAEEAGIMYRISYMTGPDATPERRGCQSPGAWPGEMSVVDVLMDGTRRPGRYAGFSTWLRLGFRRPSVPAATTIRAAGT